MNKKGFTLVELLGVIVIIGLVVGLSSYGIIKVYNNSKEKSLALTNESIKKAAVNYSEEKNNDVNYWKKSDNNSYFCVTVIELINKGYLKKDKISKDRYDDYVSVVKNDITKVVDDTVVLSDDDNNICNDSVINEKVTKPEIKTITSCTDEIEFEFIDAEVESTITDRKCKYRDLNGVVRETSVVDENKCQIDNLKDNTDYYELKVCAITSKGSIVCSNPNNAKTKSLKKPTISVNNTVEIYFDDTNIKGTPGHYFKSTVDGSTTQEVLKCALNNNVFTCEENSTNTIEKNIWYKTNDDKVNISYNESGHGNITARITDKSNNYNESSKDISIYKVTFVKGLADEIEGQTKDIYYYCVAEKNATCKMKSPNFERNRYNSVGWNENANAHDSLWNIGVEKQINRDITYYPITSKNITITFDGNGADNQIKTCSMYNSDTNCSITSPTLSQIGGVFVGWNTNNNATSSSWDGNTLKNVDADETWYAIWKKNKVEILYNINLGTNNSPNFGNDNFGYVTISKTCTSAEEKCWYKEIYNYGDKLRGTGLLNYNNSSYLNVTRNGYIVEPGYEWKCFLNADCNRTFGQATVYDVIELCNAKDGDCRVRLGINWIKADTINQYMCSKNSDYYYIDYCINDSNSPNNGKCHYSKKGQNNSVVTANGYEFRNNLLSDVNTCSSITKYRTRTWNTCKTSIWNSCKTGSTNGTCTGKKLTCDKYSSMNPNTVGCGNIKGCVECSWKSYNYSCNTCQGGYVCSGGWNDWGSWTTTKCTATNGSCESKKCNKFISPDGQCNV